MEKEEDARVIGIQMGPPASFDATRQVRILHLRRQALVGNAVSHYAFNPFYLKSQRRR